MKIMLLMSTFLSHFFFAASFIVKDSLFRSVHGKSYMFRTKSLKLNWEGPGLVLQPSFENLPSFDSKSIGGPVVKRFIDENGNENWKMYYHGRSVIFDEEVIQLSTGRIGQATSANGLKWKKHEGSDFSEDKSVLDVNKVDWWTFDTAHIGLGDVVIGRSDVVISSSAMHFMYYFGGSFEQVDLDKYGLTNSAANGKAGIKTRIGVAVSQDGVNWGRVEGHYPTGCILDVGSDNEFDCLFLNSPQVINYGSELFRLYYHSLDPVTKKNTIGLAMSRDGINFEKRGPVFAGGPEGSFDEFGASRRFVIFIDTLDAYVMFYEALSKEQKHTIGLAISPDGFEWERMYNEPIFEPSHPDTGYWDSGAVGSPYIVNMGDGTYRMYYVGSPATGERVSAIGVAQCTSTDFTRWERLVL